MTACTYYEKTYNAPGLCKRFGQRRRLSLAAGFLKNVSKDFDGAIVDIGGGSGALCALLSRRFPRAHIYCYEPAQRLRKEAVEILKEFENITVVDTVERCTEFACGFIFCLEFTRTANGRSISAY